MKFNLKDFINNDREYPVLAGIIIGFYTITFYYSNNLELFSWQQFAFFVGYYALFPALVIWGIFRFLRAGTLKKYARQGVFIAAVSFFVFFALQNLNLTHSYIKIFALAFVGIVLLSFKVTNYKTGIFLVFIMSLFPTFHLMKIMSENAANPTHWNVQPDAIESCKFTKTPNVYFLQVDGYANATALKGKLYDDDNSEFDRWIKSQGFTVYDHFRSNYPSTLKSNASCFNMKHHYSKENSLCKTARDYIVGENPVLNVFKNNGYRTFFITERPYLIMNRPKIAYDFSNFPLSELPFLKDGWSDFKAIAPEVKSQILKNKHSKNFFFVQKLSPSHISTSPDGSLGIAGERAAYLKRLHETNIWIKDLVSFINTNDPNSIVILGADHGGFVGFANTHQAISKITDPALLQSIFGASMAIKWNNKSEVLYENHLKTSVNLFRVLFAFMSDNSQYVNHLQADISYNQYDLEDYSKVYKAIE